MQEDHVGTLHALCYRALDRPELVDDHLDEWNSEHPGWAVGSTDATVDDLGDEASGENPGDRIRAQADLLRARRMPVELWPAGVRGFGLAWADWMRQTGRTDFTGLLERAIEECVMPPGNPKALLGDEAQDWSPLEAHLFRDVWGAGAETVVMVADPDQAIYEWRGANPRIFLDHPVPEENARVLSQSYRVPRAVHELALRTIRRIQGRADVAYFARDAEGAVTHNPASWRAPDQLAEVIEEALAEDQSVMILASCGYLLAPTLDWLRKRATPFSNPWRRQRSDWNPLALPEAGRRHSQTERRMTPAGRLLSFLRPEPAVWGDQAREWELPDLRAWCDPLSAKGVLTHGAKTRLASHDFNVRAEFGDLFVGGLEGAHAQAAFRGDLDWYLENLLGTRRRALEFPVAVAKRLGGAALLEKKHPVTVGTIHSVKGAEADVVIVYPDLSLSAARDAYTPEGRDALQRVLYVAVTRARERVVVCDPATPTWARVG